ncbi:MAG: CoA-binding protein, partial [Euryarchaeota archaeon]|nr:CoA-binding protein [Euryarchaeota archaeon]
MADLTGLFSPERVAVVGATPREGSVGRAITANLRDEFEGEIVGINPNYEEVLGIDCVDSVARAGDPESGDNISFARYRTEHFRKVSGDPDEEARSHATVGLLRSGLLKRFESSIHAFGNTVSKMAREHGRFIEALDAGRVISTQFLRELAADDEAVFEDLLKQSDLTEDADDFHIDALREAVNADLEKLQSLAALAKQITPDTDPKLQALITELKAIAKQAAEEASSGEDEAQKRKVLIFSFFADTVDWIRAYLEQEIPRHPELAGYIDRLAAVSGSDDIDGVSRQEAVRGFAPVSMQSPSGEDLYDALVTTDVLAEGVNLQQCRHIINFDMPWNPMRLVQRHGRIDRIASPHKRVFLRTIFPLDRLDELLNLEQRILDKLAMAAASVGVAAPIEGAAHGTQVFTETREEIERLLEEDPALYERGGTESAAQSSEEYRQTLRKALQAADLTPTLSTSSAPAAPAPEWQARLRSDFAREFKNTPPV